MTRKKRSALAVFRESKIAIAGSILIAFLVLGFPDSSQKANPSSGKPNHYGEVQSFRLPHSGLPVTYSVKYFQVIDDDPDSLVPDLLIEPRISDYLNKADPVLEKLLGERNP